MKKGSSCLLILIQYGGQDMIVPSRGTLNHSKLLSPNRYLDGVAATQSYLFGRTTFLINALNMG